MGAKIRYTHDGDLMQKLAIWIGSMILVMLVAGILDPIARPLESFLEANGLEWFWVAIMWAYIIGAYIASVNLLTKYIFQPWRVTLKYARSFGVNLSKQEAEKISFLTDGTLSGKWYPLDWLRDIDPIDKKRHLFDFANNVADNHGIQRPFNNI